MPLRLTTRQPVQDHKPVLPEGPRFGIRHYYQTENAGTYGRPIVNNCTTCTIYNLLSFFDQDQELDVKAALIRMMDKLSEYDPQLRDFLSIKHNPNSGRDEFLLTYPAIRKFLTLLGTDPELVDPTNRWGVRRIEQAILDGKPFVILDDRGTTMLSGLRSGGHCYLVYPGHRNECLVGDSLLNNPVPIPLDTLREKLFKDPKSTALIINQPPNIDRFYRHLRR
jgi:hypothetical protein